MAEPGITWSHHLHPDPVGKEGDIWHKAGAVPGKLNLLQGAGLSGLVSSGLRAHPSGHHSLC